MWAKVRDLEAKITENLEWANLRDAFHQIFEISDIANKAFQDGEPWKTRNENPEAAAKLIHNLCYVIKDLMIMAHPYIPQYAEQILSYLGKQISEPCYGEAPVAGGLNWSDLGKTEGLDKVGETAVFFTPLDQKTADAFRERFSGSQAERKEKAEGKQKKEKKQEKKAEPAVLPEAEQPAHFAKNIQLKVAKIVKVDRNPDSDKLYVEHLDDGSGTDRVIQSGLVPYLKEEDLLGKHVIIADNLAPRKMRGIESRGMLLAADYNDENGKECVELITAPWAEPGTKVVLEGDDVNGEKPAEIQADVFFQIEIKVCNRTVQIGGKNLTAAGKALSTEKTVNGPVS